MLRSRLRFGWYDFIGRLAYLFTPGIVIACELIAVAVCDIVCILLMCFNDPESVTYAVAIAIMTGITASGILAVITEMSNNYRRNSIRCITLSELFSFLSGYESDLAVYIGDFDCKRLEADMCRDLNIDIEDSGSDGDPLCKDRVEAVLGVLPKLIPIVKDAYYSHYTELSSKEVDLLKRILSNYNYLISRVRVKLYSYVNFHSPEGNDIDSIQDLFGKNTAKKITDCASMDINDTGKDEAINKIAEEILLRGAHQLRRIGMKINDEAAGFDDEDADASKREIASGLLRGIDIDIIELTGMVRKEPGHNIIHQLSLEQMRRYKKNNSETSEKR